MIFRSHTQTIQNRILNSDKILILYGPRQAGKTTLVRNILKALPLKSLEINADEQKFIDILSSRDLEKMKLMVEGYDLLFIDEAQRIPDIGINLKILHDQLPALKIVATGSSSFDLANSVREPLTGRTWTFVLYPISIFELRHQWTPFELNERLEQFLIFGMYPEIFSYKGGTDKAEYLTELTSAYLYKDVLELSTIKHSYKINKLLRLLAFQIGSLVSLNELSDALEMSKDTVANYIDLLEKSFVIFRLTGYSRNLRKEISKMDKIYFYDLGVRNSIIDNFRSLDYRDDIGQLWENFLMTERMKTLGYRSERARKYFWRTYSKAEMDYVEEKAGELFGYEFKFNPKKTRKPRAWIDAFPNAPFSFVHRENYLSFLT